MGEEMDSNGFFAVKRLLPAQFSPLLLAELVKERSFLQAPRRSGLGVPASLRKPMHSLTTFRFSEILQVLKSQITFYLIGEEIGQSPSKWKP